MAKVRKPRGYTDDKSICVYISDDDNKIPILIQSKIIVGSIKAELSGYRGLSHPFYRIQ